MQMALRSLTMTMMVLGFFFNSEDMIVLKIDNFITLGVSGSYAIITLGLLIESGLQLKSDKLVEASFLIAGIVLSLLSATLSFINFYSVDGFKQGNSVNSGIVTILATIILIVDFILLLIH